MMRGFDREGWRDGWVAVRGQGGGGDGECGRGRAGMLPGLADARPGVAAAVARDEGRSAVGRVNGVEEGVVGLLEMRV